MSVFDSTGVGSSGRDGCPILDAEEVGNRLNLDPTTALWLKQEPSDDYFPILVLSFQTAFVNLGNFEANKQIVSTALTNSGATLISDNVFKYDDWQTMFAAKDSMWINFRWCFYHPHLETAQKLNICQQPTITTTVISWFPEVPGKLTTQPYEFFKL